MIRHEYSLPYPNVGSVEECGIRAHGVFEEGTYQGKILHHKDKKSTARRDQWAGQVFFVIFK
jgi:hypothetical protein